MYSRAFMAFMLVLVSFLGAYAQGGEYHKGDESDEKAVSKRRYDERFAKGIVMTSVGSGLLVGGVGIGVGGYFIRKNNGFGYDQYGNSTSDPGKRTAGTVMMYLGAPMAIVGIVFTAVGAKKLATGRRFSDGREVSYSPYINPGVNGSCGMNVSLRF